MVKAVFALHKTFIDRLGIGLSGLCLVHCLALPFVYIAFPNLPLFEHGSELTHAFLGTLVISLAILALYRGSQAHGNPGPMLLGLLGGTLLIAAFLIPGPGELHAEAHRDFDAHVILTVLGSIGLIIAHLLNLLHCQSCPGHRRHHHSKTFRSSSTLCQ